MTKSKVTSSIAQSISPSTVAADMIGGAYSHRSDSLVVLFFSHSALGDTYSHAPVTSARQHMDRFFHAIQNTT